MRQGLYVAIVVVLVASRERHMVVRDKYVGKCATP
jgi:hypothetical protein